MALWIRIRIRIANADPDPDSEHWGTEDVYWQQLQSATGYNTINPLSNRGESQKENR